MASLPSQSSSIRTSIIRVKDNSYQEADDFLAAEEPLEIRLIFGPATDRRQQCISVTMRTPGQDFELAAGFLFTEGIIQSAGDIRSISYCDGRTTNIVRVALKRDVEVNIAKLERNFYTTSSCGVCGKASIDAVRTVRRLKDDAVESLSVQMDTLVVLPDKLRRSQTAFESTGGLHGCALFDAAGNLILSREDVGRHNAVDKLIGAALRDALFPLHNHILLLSGRSSFELIQKAWMAGIRFVAAVGAPSSLAVELAAGSGMTLVGFLRGRGFNIYSGSERIVISNHEDSH